MSLETVFVALELVKLSVAVAALGRKAGPKALLAATL